MAERLGEAVLELRTDDSRFTQGVAKARGAARGLEGGIQKTERAAERLGRRLSNLGSRAQRLGQTLSLRLTAPLAGLAIVAVRAADVQIQAERRLAAAIRASGGDAEAQLKTYKEIAAELQRLTVVGDETTLANIQIARSMGLSERAAARAAKNAIALSAAFGINANSAIRYTAALEEGDTTMLNRYIPTLRLIKDDSERVAEAQRIMAAGFLVAIEAARSGLGPFEQMTNNFGDFLEMLGKDLLNAMRSTISGLNDLALRLKQISPEARRTALALGAIAAALGPGLIALGLMVRVLGVALVGLVAFSRGVRVAVRIILAELALLAAAFASPVFAAAAAATAILAAWLLFKETIIATSKAIVDGVSFWLVKQFRNNVERPFLQAVNDLIEALPRVVRERLGIIKIDIPVEITGDAGEVFAEGFAEARAAAERETAKIEAEFDALVARVKAALPEGLAELIFGDFSAVERDIEGATFKLDAMIERLTGAAAGAGQLGTAAATAEETDALRDFMVALENETFLLGLSDDEREVRTRVMQANAIAMREGNLLTGERIALIEAEVRAQQALRRAQGESSAAERRRAEAAAEGKREEEAATREIAFTIDGVLDQAMRGHIRTWEDLRRAAVDALQDIIKSVLKLLAVQSGGSGGSIGEVLAGGLVSVLGGLGGGGTGGGFNPASLADGISSFGHGGRPSVGQLALVGERGPEIFVPDVAGTIIPNDALGGGRERPTVNVAYNVTTPDANSFRVSERQLIRLTKRRFKI